ncbi:MAG: nucleotide exchange factor GrpE [Solobacterium sp.]|nr:nucleotide exchange factor GrpE [Solobacterium sp.]
MSEEVKEEVQQEETAETPEVPAEETEAVDEIPADPRDALIEELQKKNVALEEEAAATKERLARAAADLENTRKRLEREAETQKKYRVQSFALDVLPVIDNCERALAVEKDEEDPYRKAFVMVQTALVNALKKEGVEEIEALGQPFDPNWHMAMLSEAKEGVEPGTVIEVLQKGYKLKDRLLRAAMVKVSE